MIFIFMSEFEDEYLRLIREKVDQVKSTAGYGEINLKIVIKDRQPVYVVFTRIEERIKVGP